MTIKKELDTLLINVNSGQEVFKDVLDFIHTHYNFTPVSFHNGEQINAANENQGSAKIFSIANIFELSQAETLVLFAEHYQSVLDTPNGNDHSNIRNFMLYGWSGFSMERSALTEK